MASFKRGVEIAMAIGLVAGVGASGIAFAQFEGDEAITKRRAEMVTIARSSGMVKAGAALELDEATLALLKAEADKMVASFELMNDPALWPAGSTHEAFSGSKAKGEIWQTNEDFMASMQAALDAAIAVQSAVETGDAELIGAAQATLQETCGVCHTNYRI